MRGGGLGGGGGQFSTGVLKSNCSHLYYISFSLKPVAHIIAMTCDDNGFKTKY